jgi:hypothetical protein
MWDFGRATHDESLRLVVAFLQINEPDRRSELITLAEAYRHSSGPLPRKRILVPQDNEPN